MNSIAKGFDKWNAANGRRPYFVSVDRKKRYFEKEGERDAEYKRLIALKEVGALDSRPATARDTLDLDEMRRLAGPRKETLLEIFKAGADRLPEQRVSVDRARELFIAEKRRAMEAGELKKVSFDQLRQTANLVKGFAFISDLRNPAFREWLLDRKLSPKGLHSFCLSLGVFLNFCVRHRFMVENPLKEIRIPKPPAKRTIFTVQETARVFKVAQDKFPDLVPLLAVEWFAGVRPHTAVLLDYQDLDRADKVIRLREGKFSQGDVDFVENFPGTLWHWLPKKKRGPIAPPRVRLKMRALRTALGYGKENLWPKDVARHTFASHFAAFSGSLDDVAFTLNHASPSTTLKFYRKRVPKEAGKNYFGMRPSKKRK